MVSVSDVVVQALLCTMKGSFLGSRNTLWTRSTVSGYAGSAIRESIRG